ncbi:hypothetical protein DFH08DRAFT_941319 [Mycena albidolilacea]|uniref:Uncharacterized protein n=1 Tax=Mycena albidolilacea TaxID=1033008 RepID=A0AAD7EH93_9AGAR|nr:hypothetical protein DFH08DRAFT_941319 [Mycena albidolilacea]
MSCLEATGPQRTQRSPLRTHPYLTTPMQVRRQHSDSDMENIDPSSSQSSAMHYPLYTAESFQNSPHNRFEGQFSGSLGRLPTLTSIVNVDKMVNDAQLGSVHRRAVHAFTKLDTDDRMMTLYVYTLQNESKLDALLVALGETNKTLLDLKVFMNENWKLTEEQEKLVKALLRHYLIKPLSSYQTISGYVQTYILKHPATLHLELYKTDPTVKESVNAFITTQINNVKSGFRKALFNSVTPGKIMSLKAFACKILDAYHLPVVPDTPPQDLLATLALMREIAGPLVAEAAKPARQRGADTGFWAKLEEELEALYTEHGQDRKSPGWLMWEENLIEADSNRYRRANAADGAHTRTELDQALTLGAVGDLGAVATLGL